MDTIFYVQRAIIECNCLTDGTGDSSRGAPNFPNSSIPFALKVLNLFQGAWLKVGHLRGQKIYTGKMFTESLYLLPLLKGHRLFRGKGNFFCVPKPGFNLHSGDTLAFKT